MVEEPCPMEREIFDILATRIGRPPDALWPAVRLASRYRAPQRALTCAVNGAWCSRLREQLIRDELQTELTALDSMSDAGAHTFFRAAPFGALAMGDDAFMVALRSTLAAPILGPQSVKCIPTAGREGRCCSLDEARERVPGSRLADTHARTCKRGGGAVRAHNLVRSRLADVVRGWGVAASEEANDFLTGELRIDLLVRSAGLADHALLAVDFTRRDSTVVQTLQTAERVKELKYSSQYGCAAVVRGFAFNELGRLGPQAHEVIMRLVHAGERASGAHPDDLRAELLANFGHALHTAMAHQYARVAANNDDRTLSAPRFEALSQPYRRRVYISERRSERRLLEMM
jgi:hypothetical protein